jgi:hypothetical protein
LTFGEAEVMNQGFQYLFAMLARFEHHPVDAVFVELEDSRCPANAVRFGNGQNNALDGFPAIVGVQKDGITILGKPLVTGLTTK